MKNRELFNKSVSILVKAYQNNKLMHNKCTMCAVGNLVAANLEYEIVQDNDSNIFWNINSWYKDGIQIPSPKYFGWGTCFITNGLIGNQVKHKAYYKGEAKNQIDSTGYTFDELAKVEFVFETADRGKDDDDWMFNGLIAVYNILCKIHEVDKEEVEKGELVFVKA